jgi:hypothetical protein
MLKSMSYMFMRTLETYMRAHSITSVRAPALIYSYVPLATVFKKREGLPECGLGKI